MNSFPVLQGLTVVRFSAQSFSFLGRVKKLAVRIGARYKGSFEKKRFMVKMSSGLYSSKMNQQTKTTTLEKRKTAQESSPETKGGILRSPPGVFGRPTK